mgnify:CR=1 FL=1
MMEERLFVAHLKMSKYDPLSSCLVDFKERATCSSVKNYQLIRSFPRDLEKRNRYYAEGAPGYGLVNDPDKPQPVLLQMGKVGKHCYNADFQHPFSLLQAFAISLCRFEANL